jgi:hypothetical protein
VLTAWSVHRFVENFVDNAAAIALPSIPEWSATSIFP